MASDSTTNNSPWYFYIRRVGRNWKIGLVDKDGDAHTSDGIEIKLYYESLPDEIEDDEVVLPIPEEFLFGFAKGCAYEYLLTEGMQHEVYRRAYESEVRKAIHRVIQQSHQPLMVKPITIVPKR